MKKIISIFLVVSSMLAISCGNEVEKTYPIITNNEDGTKTYDWGETKPTILTLGDSIAAGYGIGMYTDIYNYKIASKTNTKTVNEAVSGYKTADVIGQLDRIDDVNPDVILMSIGANSVLGVITSNLTFYTTLILTALSDGGEENLKNALIEIEKDYTSEARVAQFEEGIKTFAEEFPKLIEKAHDKYKETPIFIQTVYNPYVGFKYEDVLNVEDASNGYVVRLNNIIKENVNKYDYLYLVDVYEAFANSDVDCINANFKFDKTFDYDPHPNVNGHELISELFIKTWEKLDYVRKK